MAGRTQLVPLLLSTAAARGANAAAAAGSPGGARSSTVSDDAAEGELGEVAELLLALVCGLGPTAVAQSVLAQQQLVPALAAMLLPLSQGVGGAAMQWQSGRMTTGATSRPRVSGDPGPGAAADKLSACPPQLRLVLALAAHAAFSAAVARSPAAQQLLHALLSVLGTPALDSQAPAAGPMRAAAAADGDSGSAERWLTSWHAALSVLEGLVSGDRCLALLAASGAGASQISRGSGFAGASGNVSPAETLLACAARLAVLARQGSAAGPGLERMASLQVSTPTKANGLQQRVAHLMPVSEGGERAAASEQCATALLALLACVRALAAVCAVSIDACSALDHGSAAALEVLSSCLEAASAAANDPLQQERTGLLRQTFGNRSAQVGPTAQGGGGQAETRAGTSERVQLAVFAVLSALASLWAQVTGLPPGEAPAALSSGMSGADSQQQQQHPQQQLVQQQQHLPQQQQPLSPESSTASMASIIMTQLGKGTLWGTPARPAKQREHGVTSGGAAPHHLLDNIAERPAPGSESPEGLVAAAAAAGVGERGAGQLQLVLRMAISGMGEDGDAIAAADAHAPLAPAVRHAACCVVHTLFSAGREAALAALELQPGVSLARLGSCSPRLRRELRPSLPFAPLQPHPLSSKPCSIVVRSAVPIHCTGLPANCVGLPSTRLIFCRRQICSITLNPRAAAD
jgi:hypothetical protein